MSEWDAVQLTPAPRTRPSLAADLRRLGLEAVILALMDAVTPEGTLVMPAHTGGRSDPELWQLPPVPSEWWPSIRESMPPFDPARTPTDGIGMIPELFRTWPEVKRSVHPHVSFAAWGARAGKLTDRHLLDFSLGEDSPLARIYDADGWVLLFGAGYDSNTSFHLAEYRVPDPPREEKRARILRNGTPTWATYQDIELDESRFARLGEDFERQGAVTTGLVGSAHTRLFQQRPAVDFAVQWLQTTASEPGQ